MALAGDVSQPDQARQLVRDVVSAWGRLDILVNNAGIWDEDVAGRGDVAVWDRTYAVNQRGAFLVTDAAVPHLEQHGGSIVFLSSTAGQRGEARHSAYAASKGALDLLHEVAGGRARTARHPRQRRGAGMGGHGHVRRGARQPARTRRRSRSSIPLGRVASAADIAGPILFLVSDLARHVQGEVVNVNGGSVLAG